LEFQTILTTAPYLLGEVFPVDASLEDVEVDVSLSFLDGVVAEAVSNGARPYQKPYDDDDDDVYGEGVSTGASAFKMTPYESQLRRRMDRDTCMDLEVHQWVRRVLPMFLYHLELLVSIHQQVVA
jgi:hypothetical protein